MEINKSKFDPICPGLFQMQLKLMSTSNQARIENREIALHNAKEKDHPIVHDVIDLMIIDLNNPLRKRRYLPYNIEKLELIMRRNPNHLNTLADLAVLYRNSNLIEKAITTEEKIDKILKGSDQHDNKEKAVCVLEQGYAELFEEYTEDGLEAQQKLFECLELIKVEKSTAVGRTKDFLCQASNNAMGARRLLFQAINCKTTHSFVNKKKSSVEMLKTGLQYLATTSYPKEHYHIWEFYYAMACSRMPGFKAADYNNKPMCQKAVQLFWQVIVNLPKNNGCFTIYRARSYAYIGYILISTSDANPKYRLLSDDEPFKSILKIPLLSFKHANDELPSDEVVLRREGMSLWILVKYGSSRIDEESFDYLARAEQVLSSSISLSPCMHQVTFSTRMKVYLEMSSLESVPLDRKEDAIKRALEDGKALVYNKVNMREVCTIAEICQRLAKFPKYYLYGPEAVISNSYLNAALDYLTQCFRAKGYTYHTAYSFGIIYFDMGDFRTATEWHKIALILSDFKLGTGNIQQLLFSILRLGEESHVYIELIHALTYIARKWKDVEFLRRLVHKIHGDDYLRSLSKYLIFLRTFPLTTQQVEIAKCLETILFRKNVITADQFGVSKYSKSTTSHFGYDVHEANLLQRVPIGIEPADVYQNYTFDYCFIMSKVNSGWIQCFVQQQLSIQMVDGDSKFAGSNINFKNTCNLLRHFFYLEIFSTSIQNIAGFKCVYVQSSQRKLISNSSCR